MNTQSWAVALLSMMVAAPVVAQSNDMAAERSRLADQRIQAEADRIAKEEARIAAEKERIAALEAAQASARASAARETADNPRSATTMAVPLAPSATDRIGMSRMLEQLRMLGQLKDSGYVTEAEFERIKAKILEGEL